MQQDVNDKQNDPDSIIAKARYLFQTYTKEGKPYTPQEVERLSGGTLNDSWLYKLLNGQIKHPSFTKLKELSDFFGVSEDFWTRPLSDESEDTAVAARPEPSGLHALSLRARVLTEDDWSLLVDMADTLIKRHIRKGDNTT